MGIRELLESLGWLFRSVFSLIVVVFVLPAIAISWILFANSFNTADFPWGAVIGTMPCWLLLLAHYISRYKEKKLEKIQKEELKKRLKIPS